MRDWISLSPHEFEDGEVQVKTWRNKYTVQPKYWLESSRFLHLKLDQRWTFEPRFKESSWRPHRVVISLHPTKGLSKLEHTICDELRSQPAARKPSQQQPSFLRGSNAVPLSTIEAWEVSETEPLSSSSPRISYRAEENNVVVCTYSYPTALKEDVGLDGEEGDAAAIRYLEEASASSPLTLDCGIERHMQQVTYSLPEEGEEGGSEEIELKIRLEVTLCKLSTTSASTRRTKPKKHVTSTKSLKKVLLKTLASFDGVVKIARPRNQPMWSIGIISIGSILPRQGSSDRSFILNDILSALGAESRSSWQTDRYNCELHTYDLLPTLLPADLQKELKRPIRFVDASKRCFLKWKLVGPNWKLETTSSDTELLQSITNGLPAGTNIDATNSWRKAAPQSVNAINQFMITLDARSLEVETERWFDFKKQNKYQQLTVVIVAIQNLFQWMKSLTSGFSPLLFITNMERSRLSKELLLQAFVSVGGNEFSSCIYFMSKTCSYSRNPHHLDCDKPVCLHVFDHETKQSCQRFVSSLLYSINNQQTSSSLLPTLAPFFTSSNSNSYSSYSSFSTSTSSTPSSSQPSSAICSPSSSPPASSLQSKLNECEPTPSRRELVE
eukprot:TRINITY_DN6941_c0_g1_i2.p1 TRINITY_DN6941_c0_g1~~TRINITY_DN6941_c0_g1_i2.p1  ORF type:complete len:612 (+),score=120.38 TRINITY_DN6941_c0_g1_i2:334-2169(+)